jgi:hypothetical protein
MSKSTESTGVLGWLDSGMEERRKKEGMKEGRKEGRKMDTGGGVPVHEGVARKVTGQGKKVVSMRTFRC